MAQPSYKDWEKRRQNLERAADSIARARTLRELETLRLRLIGRKGKLTSLLKKLKDIPLDERRRLGPLAHEWKSRLETAIQTRREELEREQTEAKITASSMDFSLPPSPLPRGRSHPITQMIQEMTSILAQMGFSWADGPLIETDYYNFQALNIPANHPARDLQDTFYLTQGLGASPSTPSLLRTHTSPVQIRYLEKNAPPVRIMAPGRVFRHEAVDASHSAVFHQVEGLYVDHKVTMADLKGTLQMFLDKLFGRKTETRFLPSYYPFTEPSADVYAQCLLCAGSGCAVCKQSGWLEILGAGLVHPEVLSGVGYDPNSWSGFAFGIGVERIALLKRGIPDIRMFYENDLRFLEQF